MIKRPTKKEWMKDLAMPVLPEYRAWDDTKLFDPKTDTTKFVPPTTTKMIQNRLYNTGMQLADCLRLLGKHEESNQVEVWVLNFLKELER